MGGRLKTRLLRRESARGRGAAGAGRAESVARTGVGLRRPGVVARPGRPGARTLPFLGAGSPPSVGRASSGCRRCNNRAHWVRTLSSPRTVQRRNPMACLMPANTGSIRSLRSAHRRLAAEVLALGSLPQQGAILRTDFDPSSVAPFAAQRPHRTLFITLATVAAHFPLPRPCSPCPRTAAARRADRSLRLRLPGR